MIGRVQSSNVRNKAGSNAGQSFEIVIFCTVAGYTGTTVEERSRCRARFCWIGITPDLLCQIEQSITRNVNVAVGQVKLSCVRNK